MIKTCADILATFPPPWDCLPCLALSSCAGSTRFTVRKRRLGEQRYSGHTTLPCCVIQLLRLPPPERELHEASGLGLFHPCVGPAPGPRPGLSWALHKQLLMKLGLCPVPSTVGRAQALSGRERGQQRRGSSPARGPAGREPPGFRQSPSCCYLWLSPRRWCQEESSSLSAFQEAVSTRDGGESKPALPVPGRRMALGRQPPAPTVSVWPCTPGRDTRVPHPAPPPP